MKGIYIYCWSQISICQIHGYKVWLDGVEQTLLKVKQVLNVCAFGINNPLIGETIAAVVEADQNIDKVELKRVLFNVVIMNWLVTKSLTKLNLSSMY